MVCYNKCENVGFKYVKGVNRMDVFFSSSRLSLLLPVIVTLSQLGDAYMRSVAFFPKEQKNLSESRKLWRRLLLWAVCSLPIYFLLFKYYGIVAFSYKAALMLGFIPYLAIFVLTVRREASRHIFVFGMSAVYSYSLHNISSIVLVVCMGISDVPLFLTCHGLLYILWFTLFLPFSRPYFRKFLSLSDFWNSGGGRYYVAFLPLVILIGPMLLQADDNLIHSWSERLYRLFLPVAFFVVGRYILVAAMEYSDYRRAVTLKERLSERLTFLKKRQQLMIKEQKKLAILRHDFRHSLRLITAMLKAGDVAEAKNYVRSQKEKLLLTETQGENMGELLSVEGECKT